MKRYQNARIRKYCGVRYLSHRSPALRFFLKIPPGWVQCGECGRVWEDDVSTDLTPTPAGRCPFEHWHREREEPKGISPNWVLTQLAGMSFPKSGSAYEYMKKCMGK
jgi:hypothetical protein